MSRAIFSSQRGRTIATAVVDDLVHVDAHELLVGPQARELLDAPHRLGAVDRRRLHDVERPAHERDVARVLLHELGVTENRLEEVVEVVRDATGQLPEGSQLLGLAQLLLDFALRGDVADDRDEPFEPAVSPVAAPRASRLASIGRGLSRAWP